MVTGRTGGPSRTLLAPVVEVARRVLADLDDRETPKQLKRIARMTDRSLAPPFQDVLLETIGTNEWFRGLVVDRWESDAADDVVCGLFLSDPVSFRVAADRIADIVADTMPSSDSSRLGDIERLTEQLAEAKRRLGRMRDELRTMRETIDERIAEAVGAKGRLLDESRLRERQLLADLDEATDRAQDLQQEIAMRQAAEAKLSQRLARRKRSSGGAVQRSTEGLPADPVGAAARLDAIERAMRPYRPADIAGGTVDDAQPLALPDGTRPDTVDAIGALSDLRLDRLLVDGYNVGGIVAPRSFSTSEGRDEVVKRAAMISRIVGTDTVVVFDAVGVEGRAAYRAPSGVDVLFSADRSADDAIVDLLDDRARSVVITNDRELQDRVVRHGALVVWSDAFIAASNA